MDLDDLLARSAPATATRSRALTDALDTLAAETEATAGRPLRRHRTALVAGAVLAVLGLGTAGAATGALPSWVPWTTASGSTCRMQFTAGPAGPDGEPLTGSYSTAERQRAVSESTEFLATFDYSSIDEQQAIRDWQVGEDAAIASQPDPGERQPRLTGDDLAITAVGAEVWHRLAAHLREDGIPTELVVFGQGWRCE